MIEQLAFYQGSSVNPYRNLAIEQYLMETVPPGGCRLYLWQNRHTVVIGRNQNPWKECRTNQLAQDGGHLARRLSGGGAVYHDLGNLNFTFLLSKEAFDIPRQLSVVVAACEALGIPARITGRNDVTVEGRKISGNAFYDSKGRAYHHGTLLVDVDMEKLGQYLVPSRAKLRAKGVDSVRSRVMNLKELAPNLTVGAMKQAMVTAFEQVYGGKAEALREDCFDWEAVAALERRNASWEWNYGRTAPADFSCGDRFSWGEAELQLQVEQGRIREALLYTDAMDHTLPERVRAALTGRRLDGEELAAGLAEGELPPQVRTDLLSLLGQI